MSTPPVAAADHAFEVWAPRPRRVRLWLEGAVHAMRRGADDWWRVTAPASPGARYGFLFDDDETVLPDPRSPRQPDGVHGPSALIPEVDGPRWAGRALRGAVVYELHIGAFTPEGTFDAAIERLPHLRDLGVGFVQVMPVNAFNGEHGWGYDGVGWFAVHEPYGGPSGLERFVAAAHDLGLGVLLDVVHNHLGPSGNYLGRFGPYETDGANTWGRTINLSGEGSAEVRRFILDDIAWWLRRYGVDGLRLDAVHALVDHSDRHILQDAAALAASLSADLGRPLALVAESDLNDPRLVTSAELGGYGLAAQWNDDVHHAIHTIVSGERQGYYADFGSPECLATVLTEGFFHAGTYSSFRGRTHGERIDPARVAPSRLLAYTCTHDQVGNRARGDRPAEYLTDGQLAVKAALVLFSAFTPMLFMGEEWGARTPFRFFTSHPEPELARATAEGRKAEFAEHGWPPGHVPDPQDPETFAVSHLDWSEPTRPEHARLLETHRALIALRRDPALAADDLRAVACDHPGEATWFAAHRGDLTLVVNFSPSPVAAPFDGSPVLSWEEPSITDGATTVPGHSFVVLRRAT
ncbi:malto-oligosyltrehalose trehalohydrolase [Tsukamurella tyrosinosolvens]|uniref:malto-oligosyltrehalose trehalohydrolase n=1 Tax=Tsukamurella tyrosinosolvens TaxID=57704 RepID=UPI001AF2C8D9|nr:malto-oligosyltrehalose trehalohydrolase [Tsukamurella tyrosinosolvens]MEC4614265.1 malto-oligosyltrehalose trehalohydrolase [Tsukamurella tyrosinosolvens]QRY83164.1 malto-oligosyltrehalose trehalohydrolase [Tsukamurella tyrosinosolvens]